MRALFTPEELAACHALIRAHARSFYMASHMLPPDVRHGAYAMYAFCRQADDAVDAPGDERPAIRLRRLTERLEAVYGHEPPESPVDRAFQKVVRAHRIPRALPEALLEGFAADCRNEGFETDDDLTRYAFQVASSVGLMMTLLMGVRRQDALLHAAHLGVAMQLTNIARDVGEDARNGRVYLPRTLCRAAGLDPEDLRSGGPATPACREAVRLLLDRAEAHYRAADAGIAMLPPGCRLAIAASRDLYSAIGRQLARQGHDAVSRRAVVSKPVKLALLGRAALRASWPARAVGGPSEGLLVSLIGETGLWGETITLFRAPDALRVEDRP